METNNQNLPPAPTPPNSQVPPAPTLPIPPLPPKPPLKENPPETNVQYQNIGGQDEKKITRKIWIIVFVVVAIVILISYLRTPSKKQIEMVADIYCATYHARYESGLGKPMDSLQPRIMAQEDAYSPRGQKFQSLFVNDMMPIMKKYNLDSGKLGEENDKADELMKKDSFKQSVLELLREKDECHAEYLE